MATIVHMSLLVLTIVKCGVSASRIQLSPTNVNVVENASITLTCSKQNGPLVESRWTNSQIVGTDANLALNEHNKCIATRFLENKNLFDFVCNANGTYSVVLKRVDRLQHGARWTCKETLTKSNIVTIYVSVPIASLDIYPPKEIYMKENRSQTIRCNTSACRPQPHVSWYLRNMRSNREHNITEQSNQSHTVNQNGLITAASLLFFLPNRSVNGWMLHCEALTDTPTTSVVSDKIVLNVSYPPDSRPIIHGHEKGEIYRVIESDTGVFLCSVTGGNPLASLRWNCFNSKTSTNVIVNKNVTSSVTWEATRTSNICMCESDHIFYGKQTTYVTTDVLYPPTRPVISIGSAHGHQILNVIKNNTLNVYCESKGNPMPNFKWNGPNIAGTNEQSLKIQHVHMEDEGQYKCSVSNLMVRSDNTSKVGSNSSTLTVIILHPPEQPVFRYGKTDGHLIEQNFIYAIKGDSFSIYCNAKGNPIPAITWDGYAVGSALNISTVSSNITRTCTAKNYMNETVGGIKVGSISASLSITVLYPPNVPSISISNEDAIKPATERIYVIEMETIYLRCYSDSRPFPRYTWSLNNTQHVEKGNVFKLADIRRSDVGKYTCYVDNIMNRTFGEVKPGYNSSNTFLNVLYPSRVGTLSKSSTEEGSNFSTVCPVIHGSPIHTEVFWTRKSDNRRWNSSQLIISDVRRTDSTDYTCIVFNEMVPTIGNATIKEKNESFYLNIFFPAEIKHFLVVGGKFKEVAVVNETEAVSFICNAEANPDSDIIIRSPQNKQISTVHQSNVLQHTLRNSSFMNAGEYTCICKNNYTNGQAESSTLILIVRCPPKPLSVNTKDGKIATLLHADVTLYITARDYLDEPNQTMFTWFKENATIENNGSKFIMSSLGLQSNLSITNIMEEDFGKYGVRVSNSVGEYIHLYDLVAKDKPEKPKNFDYINNSVTDSSVIVNWMPGFHGGYPQTFILMYKRNTGRKWQNDSIEDTGDKEMNYTLVGLLSMTEYQVKMFSRNREGDSVLTGSHQFTTKAPVTTPQEVHSSNTVAVVAGSISAIILVSTTAGVSVLILIYRKRNNKGNKNVYQNIPFKGNNVSTQRNHESLDTRETLFEGLQDVDDVPIITNERTEYCNSPDMIEKIDRIKVTELLSYVSGRGEGSFEADYQKLPTELQRPCTFARKPENIALNRYNGIYPYDHSRVTVHGEPDFFINACYINGYQSSKAYIASLGPTAKTTNEFITFWKMVWSEKVDVIVMLTNLQEPSGMKCEKYWPEGGATIWYGDVGVSNKTTECFAEYTIRQFSVTKEDERRSLTHLHYTAWPDKTVPEDVTSLIEFRQRMKTTPTSSEGPVVVHCSAGIGRTGTLIALDRLIKEGQDKGSLNVFECVEDMREQRVKMVQTFEQYMYIYKALVNALTFDCETIPVETFNEYVEATNNNMYSMMFQQLRQSVETDSKADVEARLKNEKLTNKNRLGADIPGSRFRAMLYLNRTDEGSEYINAVYINSFVKRDNFIAVQSPLPCTVADFLTMVYQEDCSCIATMEDLKDPGMTVGQYLPDDKKTMTVGNFKVSSSGLETKHNYVVRKMKIKYSGKFDNGEKIIYHFQYTKWMTGHDTPMNAKEFVQFVNEVKEYANELGEERSHVIVHCLKANERSGLFCALAILMEKIKLERQVNVLNTVRHLRTRRQTAITSMEQLKFCFQATSEYIKMNMLG